MTQDQILLKDMEAKTMNDFLRQRYLDFVDDLDPYRDTSEDPSTLEEMLYNLLAIKENSEAWSEDELGLYEVLEATIEQFKAAGIEII